MKHIFFFLTAITLFACNNTNKKEHIQFSDFKNIIELNIDSGKTYSKLDIFNRAPRLYFVNNILIAENTYSTDKFIHFFKNHKYLKSVGKIGRGADELVRPSLIYFNKTDKYLWIIDWGRVTFLRYNMDTVLNTDKFIGQKFNFKKTISYEMEVVSDTSILCNTQYEPPYLYRILSEHQIRDFAKPEEILPEVQKLDHPLYMTTFQYDPSTARIYMAFRNLDVLMCMDTTGKVIFKKTFFDKIGIDKKVKDDRNEISTFSFLKIFDDKIFVLYCGLTYFQEGNVGQPVPNFPDKLLVFDLEGNPETLIKFDREIFDYIYDAKNNELIVYSLSSEIYPFIYYNIKL
jgi:hypothetical protein